MMATWDELLPDLLAIIVRKVQIYEDFVAFGGVCKSWRSVAVKGNLNQQLVWYSSSPCSVQPPWLMLAEEEGTDTVLHEFVNMSKGGMVRKMELPEARGRRCMGSMGWLITVDQEGGMELLHPLTRVSISLPHLRTYPWYENNIDENRIFPVHYVHRATLSASPSTTEDYAVMLILGIPAKLAFLKPGNAGWTFLETTGAAIYDVIYHKGMFYAVDIFSNMFACNVGGQNPTVEIVGRLPRRTYVGKFYLAEYSGEIILVTKIAACKEDKCLTVDFRICKRAAADHDDDDSTTGGRRGYYKWEEVNDLGEGSIFVGFNTPISVPCAVAVGLKPDCIYFTDVGAIGEDGEVYGGMDMGIYNLATRSMEPLYRGGTSPSNYCPPIWVSPCLYLLKHLAKGRSFKKFPKAYC